MFTLSPTIVVMIQLSAFPSWRLFTARNGRPWIPGVTSHLVFEGTRRARKFFVIVNYRENKFHSCTVCNEVSTHGSDVINSKNEFRIIFEFWKKNCHSWRHFPWKFCMRKKTIIFTILDVLACLVKKKLSQLLKEYLIFLNYFFLCRTGRCSAWF